MRLHESTASGKLRSLPSEGAATQTAGREEGAASTRKTIGIIQARMGSERLPGKILAPLGGRPLLAQLCSRIRPARVDEWWLATTSDPADDVTEAKTPSAPMRFGFAAAWPRATQMLTQLMNRIGVRPELAKRPSCAPDFLWDMELSSFGFPLWRGRRQKFSTISITIAFM